ncbi:MAG: hypothetical protein PXZ08_05065 [Actinomycetota bacterium]|nr:hypothetical protein [Actinomycetota bacterium]
MMPLTATERRTRSLDSPAATLWKTSRTTGARSGSSTMLVSLFVPARYPTGARQTHLP